MERRAFAKLFGLGAAGAVASVVPMGKEETAQARGALEREQVEKTFYKGHVIWWWESIEDPGKGCWAARRRASQNVSHFFAEDGSFPTFAQPTVIRSATVRRRRFAFGRDERFRQEKVDALDWIKRYIDNNWTGRA